MNTQRKQRDIHGFLFKTVAILLMLVLVSTSLVTGRYARYTTTASSSDSARVAKFKVTGTGSENITFDCTATDPGRYTVKVKNESEVAVSYSIGVTFGETVENKILVTLDSTPCTISDKTIAPIEKGTLDPNADAEASHELTFKVSDYSFVTAANGTTGDAEASTGKVSKALPFTIHITATQID